MIDISFMGGMKQHEDDLSRPQLLYWLPIIVSFVDCRDEEARKLSKSSSIVLLAAHHRFYFVHGKDEEAQGWSRSTKMMNANYSYSPEFFSHFSQLINNPLQF